MIINQTRCPGSSHNVRVGYLVESFAHKVSYLYARCRVLVLENPGMSRCSCNGIVGYLKRPGPRDRETRRFSSHLTCQQIEVILLEFHLDMRGCSTVRDSYCDIVTIP